MPDIPGSLSGWNTDNHYFYEVVNRTGKNVYIKFSISSQNATEEFLSKCEWINEFYPSKFEKEEWQWRSPFKTSMVEIDEDISKDSIYNGLDECLKEIRIFETDLMQKMDQ